MSQNFSPPLIHAFFMLQTLARSPNLCNENEISSLWEQSAEINQMQRKNFACSQPQQKRL
jgi:hypothetical protein